MSIFRNIIFHLLVFASISIAFANEVISASIDENYPVSIDVNTDIKIYNNVYDRPYSFWENDVDKRLLKAQTYTILGASVVGLGILYAMPESFTNWDKGNTSNVFKKWRNNVSDGPVVDGDDFFLNYVTHPYWGAVYYMTARSAGFNAPYSFLYSAFVSTFFWEYGIEAFAEVPSKQDLIVTPVVGSIIGEGFYWSKRLILGNNYYLLDSKILGHVAVFLMDPITEVAGWFIKNPESKKDVAIYSFPTISHSGDIGYHVMLSLKF